MFGLDKQDASIINFNLRKEKHGDESVPAADLKFELAASALLLDSIDPGLRKSFFAKPGKGQQQTLPIDGNNLTALSLPMLDVQKIKHEYEGYEVELHSLLEYVEPIFFADAKVKKLAFLPIEGGSITLSLTVSVRLDEEDDAPLLAAWRRGDVRLSLTPPTAKPQEDGDTLEQQEADAEASRLIEAGKQAA